MRIIIAGGGIGGLTAALCLAKQGFEVAVFEQASTFAEIGAGLQLSPNCTRVLHHLGLEPALRERAFLPEAVEFRDWKQGTVLGGAPLGATLLERHGFPYYHMHRGDLLQILVAAARRAGAIELHVGERVVGCQESGGRVVIASGSREEQGDVLVGADGIHSQIRAALWGADAPTFTGNIAWRALVPVERLPQGLIRPMSTAWWGPQRHFVHYYVRGGSLVNCVCVVEKQDWAIESWTERGSFAELKSDFAGWHDDIQQLIDHADQDSLFKWALFDRPPMPQWGRGRVTLLGDACHPTLPFMAQGAAMAIEDAAVLAACLAASDDIPANLQRYEQLRRDRTARIQRGSRSNARMFHLAGAEAEARNQRLRVAGERPTADLYGYDALQAANSKSSGEHGYGTV